MSVLPLVCLRLGLLRLRPQPVAAVLTPGLGVLFTLAVATRRGWFADPAGLRAWLQLGCLPHRAAGAGTRASQARYGFVQDRAAGGMTAGAS